MTGTVFLLASAVGLAEAAPPTCRDLLLAHGPKWFTCDLTLLDTSAGPPFDRSPASLLLEFSDATPVDPATFELRTSGGATGVCACGPRGSVANPTFLTGRTFTCVDQDGLVTQGQVSGGKGNRIKSLTTQIIAPQSSGGSQIAIGSCRRAPEPTPTPTPPVPTPTPQFSCGVPNPGPTGCDVIP